MKYMKRIIFLAVGLVAAMCAGAEEVKYYNKSWAEVQARAKKEHKYIFIDCYTDWCGWCKVMDKETMSDAAIAAELNGRFVPVKMEMEHGEGARMAMKYHVTAFPSFLVFDEEGNYVYQVAGYQKKEAFSKLLTDVRDKTKQMSAPGYSKSLDVAYPQFYVEAHAENGKRKFPKAEEVTKYLDEQKDLFSEASWAVIGRFAGDAKYGGFFMENSARYKELYGKAAVQDKMNSMLGQELEGIMKRKDDAAFAAFLLAIDKYMGEDAPMSRIYCCMAYYKAAEKWGQYASTAADYIAREGYANTDYINTICWDVYEKCGEMAAISNACGWMKEVVARDAKYAHLDTYAALLYKAGDLPQAKAQAEMAIKTGREEKADVKATEELLAKIKAKM